MTGSGIDRESFCEQSFELSTVHLGPQSHQFPLFRRPAPPGSGAKNKASNQTIAMCVEDRSIDPPEALCLSAYSGPPLSAQPVPRRHQLRDQRA